MIMYTQAALRKDSTGAGRVAVECVAGCFGFGDWGEGDATYLGVMQRTWAELHDLPVYAGPDLTDHGEQGLSGNFSLG
jgi:hypothetical protein